MRVWLRECDVYMGSAWIHSIYFLRHPIISHLAFDELENKTAVYKGKPCNLNSNIKYTKTSLPNVWFQPVFSLLFFFNTYFGSLGLSAPQRTFNQTYYKLQITWIWWTASPCYCLINWPNKRIFFYSCIDAAFYE